MAQLTRSGVTRQPWQTSNALENHSDRLFPTRTQLSLSEQRSSRRRQRGEVPDMLSKVDLESTTLRDIQCPVVFIVFHDN